MTIGQPAYVIASVGRWRQRGMTGQQFLDQTRGFVEILMERFERFWPLYVLKPEEYYTVSPHRLERDLSDFDDKVIAALDLERSASKEFQEFKREGLPCRHFDSMFSTDESLGELWPLFSVTLGDQLSYDKVEFHFPKKLQQPELVRDVFRTMVQYWAAPFGWAGFLDVFTRSEQPNQYYKANWLTCIKDPLIIKKLPDFVKATQVGCRLIIEINDEADFADSAEGARKARALGADLISLGVFDIEEVDVPPPWPRLTPEELSAMGIGGATAPIKPRRFPKR